MRAGRGRRPRPPADSSAALSSAVRAAARFDRRLVSIPAGLLAAIPVAAALGAGLAAGDPVTAVTMGAGAMLVGIAWRTQGGQPPLGLMATDALLMAISTFVGSVTGSLPLLHLAVLCVWSLLCGLLVSAGNRGGVLGIQAIIAVIVFGRFSEPPAQALGLAGLVFAGGCAQVLFSTVVRWPPPLRVQRAATATAYRALSALAAAPADASTLPAAEALDAAEASLNLPVLFADPAVMTLRSLVSEGQRLRAHLSGIQALHRRAEFLADTPGSPAQGNVRHVLEQLASGLALAADAIEGSRSAAAALEHAAGELSLATADIAPSLPKALSGRDARPGDSLALQASRRISALAGQFRAVAALAPAAGRAAGLRQRRLHRRVDRPITRLRTDLAQMYANATLASPAGRHALRLAVVVPVAELISRQLPLNRGYWMVVAAATVLRPEFGATLTRGTERALGTCLGVALAGAIAVGLHPTGTETVVIVGLLAWAGYASFPASFAIGFGFITAVVVFLLNEISPDTLATAAARLLDTLVGGAIGLIAYALWPTWSQGTARQSLADLAGAHRAYIKAVLDAVSAGDQADDQQLRALSRRARLARTKAVAAVARSLSEPATRRIDAEQSQAALSAMRRLIQVGHLLAFDAQESRHPHPFPMLAPLAAELDELLGVVEQTFRDAQPARPPVHALPDLRASYFDLEHSAAKDLDTAALLTELDEMVDAANGLAAIAGLDWIDADPGDNPNLASQASSALLRPR